APPGIPDPQVDGLVHLCTGGRRRHTFLSRDLVDELRTTPLEDLGDAVQHLAAVVRRGARPALHRRTSGDDGIPSILARALGGVRQERALGGEHLIGATGLAAGELSPDRELVGLRNSQSLAHAAAPSRYAVSPWRPPSRPYPDSLQPPNGLAGSKRLNVFAQTTPARSRSATARMREPLSVHIPADSPYGVLLALATASAGVRNVSTESTGPKTSSRAMRRAG